MTLKVDAPVTIPNETKQNPPQPRCECGHKKQTHKESSGKFGVCKWMRRDEKGKKVLCDCQEYWLLENH